MLIHTVTHSCDCGDLPLPPNIAARNCGDKLIHMVTMLTLVVTRAPTAGNHYRPVLTNAATMLSSGTSYGDRAHKCMAMRT